MNENIRPNMLLFEQATSVVRNESLMKLTREFVFIQLI
jgi:hypothetical protein